MGIVRWLTWPTIVVNVVCTYLGAATGSVTCLLWGLIGTAAGLYAWLLYKEEMEMAHTRYFDVAMRLRWELKEEGYLPGDRLPSNEALAKRCNVTRTTVRKALQLLTEEGLVEQIHGRGTFALGPDGAKGKRTDRPRDVIEHDLRATIEKTPPGQQLPTASELMSHYKVSHPTVRRVQLKLVDEGLMKRTRGGSYIRA